MHRADRHQVVGADHGGGLLCLAVRAATEGVRLPLAALGATGLETLFGADPAIEAGTVVLPGEGPAFHVWRLR